jgi:hypothetical protein
MLSIRMYRNRWTNNNKVRSQLQMLLNRASRLYSLKSHGEVISQVDLSAVLNPSVRRLELTYNRDLLRSRRSWLCSSLGIQCEVLHINVQSASDIINK